MVENADLDQLIHAHLEGTLDEAGCMELGRRIVADPAVARRVLSQAFVADHLPEALAALKSTTARLRHPRTSARRWPIRLAVAASLLVAIGALALMWGSARPAAEGMVVALEGTAKIRDSNGTSQAILGSHLPAGAQLLLDEGAVAEVRLQDGSSLALTDNAAVTVGDQPGEAQACPYCRPARA